MPKILVVDDDQILTELICAYLSDRDYVTDVAHTGEDAKTLLCLNSYDLIVLDWMIPDCSGIEVCKQYRARGGTAAILMLTSKSDKHEKATGLDAGADDYLVKPFEQVEFLARVRALLRRPVAWAGKVLKVRDLELNTASHKVFRGGEEITLRPREFAVLELLARHPGQDFTAESIFKRVWDSNSEASIETVRMHVMALRKKLRDSDHEPLISSMRGRGYRLEIGAQS